MGQIDVLANSEISRPAGKMRRYAAGYWSLLLLILLLPFDLSERPILSSPFMSLTNLTLVYYWVVGLGLFNLAPLFKDFLLGIFFKKPDHTNFFYRHKVVVGLFGGLLVASLLSSFLAQDTAMQAEGYKWTLDLLTGGVLLLGTLLWLSGRDERDFQRLGLALVAGGVVSAMVGFGEFVLGNGFADSLAGWFKAKTTTAGPFLRLSGTFEYANVAAMYFEIALPFALAGLRYSLVNKSHAWQKVGWLVAAGLLFEALLLTLTRGAWLGAASSLGLMT